MKDQMKNQNGYKDHFKKAQSLKSAPVAKKNLTEQEVEAQLRKAFGMKQMPQPQRKVIAQRKKKNLFPTYPMIALMAMFVGLSSYMAFPEFFDDVMPRIEISSMGRAQAKEESKPGKNNPSTKPSSPAKAAAAKNPAEPTAGPQSDKEVQEELSYLSKLRERKEALDLREAELNQLEEELQRQKSEVEKRIAELSQVREEIATKLEDRVEADEGKVKKLVDLYSSMKPKQAAKIIETVNTDLAVEVLANMKKKSAADIMNVMDDKVAKELSERLTGYKRSPSSMSKK